MFDHYFDIDPDVIFNVCENHIEKLRDTIRSMITDLEDK